MNPPRRARRRSPPTPAPAPMPAFAPVDNCEKCAACDVLLGVLEVGHNDEVVVVNASALPDLELCEVVERGV